MQGWVEQTPDDLVLTIKMSRYVTHVKRLRDLAPSMELFYQRIDPLVRSPKLGQVREAFVYFNNDWEGFAPGNALRLRELVGVPPRD